MLNQVFNWFQNASWIEIFIVLILVSILVWYIFFNKRQRKRIPVFVERPQGATGALLPIERKDLLDVVSIQPVPLSTTDVSSNIGFPTSPIMPDLNVIDEVAPYNPDISGKEWANVHISSDTFEVPATDGTIRQNTPTPQMIPIPTMVPSPTNVTVAKKESFAEGEDPYNGYVDQPLLVDIKTPIDAQMSKWTQFGSCNPQTRIQERTRTCVHDGIDGGKHCQHTIEGRKC
jgi:hypothetical protein